MWKAREVIAAKWKFRKRGEARVWREHATPSLDEGSDSDEFHVDPLLMAILRKK